MPRKRTKMRDSREAIVADIEQRLESLPTEASASVDGLRKVILENVQLFRNVRELGLFYAHGAIKAQAASERILQYLRLFVGQPIEGEELEVVSGISEYARRIREWRVEFGWPIHHAGSTYILQRDSPDDAKAELWQKVNSIRRIDVGAREKMLRLFQALPGVPVTTAQLRYVTENKDLRRVRELRTEFGWRIMTNKTGMPQLKNGEYVLVDLEPMESHDRKIEDSIVVKVLARDRNQCRKCGWHPSQRHLGDPRQYIELHHKLWHSKGGTNELENLITLCNVDHKEVHRRKVSADQLDTWLAER